jgi:hypothetical protein
MSSHIALGLELSTAYETPKPEEGYDLTFTMTFSPLSSEYKLDFCNPGL